MSGEAQCDLCDKFCMLTSVMMQLQYFGSLQIIITTEINFMAIKLAVLDLFPREMKRNTISTNLFTSDFS